MNEISEDVNQNKKQKYSIKLKQSPNNSNNSQNEDEIFFSSNFLFSDSNYIAKANSNIINKSKKIFDSVDSPIKKKLFSSENFQKSDNQRNSEINSTEPASSKVKEFKQQKRRFSMVKLIEKEKRNKKYHCRFAFKKEEKIESPEKKERRDIYGNIISKKNKKNVKVSFVDKVTAQPLANIVDIECFKNYNYISGLPKEDKIDKSTNCQCCLIF